MKVFYVLTFIILFIQVTKSQTPSVEWGEMMKERCENTHGNTEECNEMQQRFESEIERIVILIETKYKISPEKLMEMTLESPYIDLGIKIIDNLINYLRKRIPFEKKKEKIKKSLLLWLIKTAEKDPKQLNEILKESNDRSELLFKEKYQKKFEQYMKFKKMMDEYEKVQEEL